MSKYSWLAIMAKDKDGGLFAYAERLHHSNNIVGYGQDSRFVAVNICDSKTECERIVAGWNDDFRKNGTASAMFC